MHNVNKSITGTKLYTKIQVINFKVYLTAFLKINNLLASINLDSDGHILVLEICKVKEFYFQLFVTFSNVKKSVLLQHIEQFK